MARNTTNQIALVTGGSRGIGLAIARHLIKRNFSVAITGRNPDHLEEARTHLGRSVKTFQGDVSRPDDVQRIVKKVKTELGEIDLMVNNAGITGTSGTFVESNPEDWWQVQEVNLQGPMLFMRAVLPGMVEHRQGTIINIGSLAAIKNLPGNTSYCVSKAALARLTDSIAMELKGTGIKLFCLSPGLVETDMTRGIGILKEVPPSEWSQPEDVCRLISKILDSNCSSLSGHFLHVHDDFETILKETERVEKEGLYQIGMNNLEGRID